ncbi:MAG TPA: GTPase [Candidatus Limnocylindria bacterium]|nr:GTPase [Candidatus Limnocylindria bacterium]
MSLETQLERLAADAAAVRDIGLAEGSDRAEEVVGRGRARAGFPGSAYVLALAGGTGVGKSSVLNALAGQTVSTVRAVRPTTHEPIAWIADGRRDELGPLLAWLDVRHVTTHAQAGLGGVAILDLPDVDSVRTEHRALVDELLPRIDAIAWVVDPEKYDDERLHGYLRSLASHADRLRFILNKVDRLTEAQRAELVDDLRRRLADAGIPDARIDAVSATSGEGIDALRRNLGAAGDAKALVAQKLATDVAEARAKLAAAVGVTAGAPYVPLVDEQRRAATIRDAIAGSLAIVDPAGVARQVQAAVLGRARRSGGSLLGRVVVLLGWLTGQSRRRADPVAYLRDWRSRGSLARAVNPVHSTLVEAVRGVPSSSRPPLMATLGADETENTIARAIDRATRDASADLRIPGSWLWPVIGALQLIVGAVFLFAVAWYVTLFLSQGVVPVATFEAPVLGPLPLPLALLAGSFVVSALLGFLLSLHAGWIGRRAGRRMADRVSEAVRDAVEQEAMVGLERIEAVRERLAGSTVE